MFIQVHINLTLIKIFWVGMVKDGQPFFTIFQGSEIDCISKMNWWNEPIFCMLVQIQKG